MKIPYKAATWAVCIAVLSLIAALSLLAPPPAGGATSDTAAGEGLGLSTAAKQHAEALDLKTNERQDVAAEPAEELAVRRVELYGLWNEPTSISSTYVITNPAPESATVQHSLYRDGSDFPVAEFMGGVSGGRSRTFTLPDMSEVPSDFVGYAIISSDQLITGSIAAAPPAISVVKVEGVAKQPFGLSASYVITNLSTAANETTHQFYDAYAGRIASVYDTLAGGESRVYDLDDSTRVPEGFTGTIRIEADEPITAALVVEPGEVMEVFIPLTVR